MKQSKPTQSELPEFIPLSKPSIGNEEIQEVVDTLTSGWITSGVKVTKFESLFEEWLQQKAVATTSATCGLHLVLKSLRLNAGDEVITSAITWPSMVNNIEHLGLRPVFVEVSPATLLMDMADLAKKITSRTKVIMPVHYAGQPCDMQKIIELVADRPINIIEDAAHALGAYYQGKPIGSQSQIAIYSFHPIKNITTGEGGMVVCKDSQLAARIKLLRSNGVTRDAWNRYTNQGTHLYDVVEPGFKYNMTDIHASLGIQQFRKLAFFNERRTFLALRYRALLKSVHAIQPLEDVKYPVVHAWHLFVVRLNLELVRITRDELVELLKNRGIGCGVHFLAVHLLQYYKNKYNFQRGLLPNAEKSSDCILSLPLYPSLTESEQDKVVGVLAELIQAHLR